PRTRAPGRVLAERRPKKDAKLDHVRKQSKTNAEPDHVHGYDRGAVIPLGDSVGGRRQVVTVGIIVVCVLVFLYELTLRGAALDAFVQQWGAVPRRVLPALALDARVPHQALLTLFTSQFMHAGLLHLGGNMLFLWVFGRAVEDRVGSAVFLAF